MTRSMLWSLAIAAILAMAAGSAVPADAAKLKKSLGTSSSGKSGKSAQKGYGGGNYFIADSFGFGVERESKKARGLRRK